MEWEREQERELGREQERELEREQELELLKQTGMPAPLTRLISIVAVGAGTSLKEIHDFEPSMNDVKWNMLGVGAAIGSTMVFEF